MNNYDFISKVNLINLISKVINEDVTQVKMISSGVMTHKYELICHDGKQLIIRFYPASIRHALYFEPDLIRKSYATGAKVPYVAYDSKGKIVEYDFIIYNKLVGYTLLSIENKIKITTLNDIISKLCDNLELIRGLPFDGFGPLVSSSSAMYNTWEDFVDESIIDGLNYVENIGKRFDYRHIIDTYLTKNKNKIFHSQIIPKFIWSDISNENIIIYKNKLSGLIDFDGAMSGDIALEAGYLYARYPDSLFFNTIMKYYYLKQGVTFEAVKFYAVMRLLRICKYLQLPLPNGCTRESPELVFPGVFKIINSL